jgi:hypothetical protein
VSPRPQRRLELYARHRSAGEPLHLLSSLERRVRTNEYKREQFPPTLRVSDRAWTGRQYPIAQRFFE